MRKTFVVLASVLIFAFAAVPSQAGLGNNGHGNGLGLGHDNGHGNGNGNGNGNNGGDNGTVGTQDNTQSTDTCDFTTDNWVEDLAGTILGFYGNPNNDKSKQKFIMETADGNVDVQTAPWWFMAAQPISFEEGDEVVVSGWLCTEDSEGQVLHAMTITKGDVTITLRNALGHPLWSGARAVPGCGQNADKYIIPDYVGDEQTLEGVTGDLYLDCTVNGSYPSFMTDLSTEDADGNPVEVTLLLGPQWYLEYQRFALPADTSVIVTGVMVEIDETRSIFLVRTVETEDSIMVFRDDNGVPLWQTVRSKTP